MPSRPSSSNFVRENGTLFRNVSTPRGKFSCMIMGMRRERTWTSRIIFQKICGPSAVEFASEIGITKSTLQSIEKENTAVRLDTLSLICSGLNIPISALLTDELEPVETSVLEQALHGLNWFSSLPTEERDEVLLWLRQTLTLFSRLNNHFE